MSRLGQNPPSSISTKYQSLNGPSESFRSKFQDLTQLQHNMVVTRDSNLLQMASFLTSNIAALINNAISHPIKIELSDYFKNVTGVQTFENEFSLNNIHFYK